MTIAATFHPTKRAPQAARHGALAAEGRQAEAALLGAYHNVYYGTYTNNNNNNNNKENNNNDNGNIMLIIIISISIII